MHDAGITIVALAAALFFAQHESNFAVRFWWQAVNVNAAIINNILFVFMTIFFTSLNFHCLWHNENPGLGWYIAPAGLAGKQTA